MSKQVDLSQVSRDSRACLLSTSPPCLRKCWKNKEQFSLSFLFSGSGLQRPLFEAQVVHLNQRQLHGHVTCAVTQGPMLRRALLLGLMCCCHCLGILNNS